MLITQACLWHCSCRVAQNLDALFCITSFSCIEVFITFFSLCGSADGMLFGALGPCPVCSSCLYYYGGQYQCSGYVSEWSNCTYSTTEPVRIKNKWKIPDETKNNYLTKVWLIKKCLDLNACFCS